ncbi:MAG: hypothetical protein KDA80_02465, partial [Planctomycetaceae bacterium]|nr:hypothetical protein [Planctomycetaceae bacterium]
MHACFVALNAYPAIEPGVPGTFGGIETRAWQFARGLAEMSDLDVSFVVRHPAPLLRPEVDGVRLILMRDRLYHVRDSLLSRLERRSRFPGIVLRHPRVSDALFLPLLAARKALIPPPSPPSPLPFFSTIEPDIFLTFPYQNNSRTAYPLPPP